MEATLISSLLVSAVAVMIMIGPAVADFNATHATNPLWTPHARFHVVWQVFTNSTVAALSLYLLWVVDAFWLAAFLNTVWFGSFFLTLAVMSGSTVPWRTSTGSSPLSGASAVER